MRETRNRSQRSGNAISGWGGETLKTLTLIILLIVPSVCYGEWWDDKTFTILTPYVGKYGEFNKCKRVDRHFGEFECSGQRLRFIGSGHFVIVEEK